MTEKISHATEKIGLPPEHAEPAITEGWQLTDEVFERWWSLLDELDRNEFLYLHRGDRVLARFVCVLDYLTIQRVKAADTQLFCLAYSIAANVPMTAANIKARATRAWNERAVQALMDRVRHRNFSQKVANVENAAISLVERMIEVANDGEDMKAMSLAANAATALIKLKNSEEVNIRAERTRKGIENARKAHDDNPEDMSEREISAMFKAVLPKMKPKELLALLPADVLHELARTQ